MKITDMMYILNHHIFEIYTLKRILIKSLQCVKMDMILI